MSCLVDELSRFRMLYQGVSLFFSVFLFGGGGGGGQQKYPVRNVSGNIGYIK